MAIDRRPRAEGLTYLHERRCRRPLKRLDRTRMRVVRGDPGETRGRAAAPLSTSWVLRPTALHGRVDPGKRSTRMQAIMPSLIGDVCCSCTASIPVARLARSCQARAELTM
jgi:hypothetical protein